MRMAQQQAQHFAMMQGMMGYGAMFGGMPPFMNPHMRPPHMMGGREDKRSKKPKEARPANEAAGAEGSSSSSSSSDDSDDENKPGMLPHQAMPPMPGMWPGAPVPMHPGGPPMHLEAYLAASHVDPEAADRLRALPPHLQQAVMSRGPVGDTRNPSAVLIGRVREVELSAGIAIEGGSAGPRHQHDGDGGANKPARGAAKVSIESMIRDYRLSAGCAWMLRALPPDKQKLAAKIDPSGQADPSGYVAEQMKNIV